MTDTSALADAVISEARSKHLATIGEDSAAFDFAIAAGNAYVEEGLRNAVYTVANADQPPVEGGDGGEVLAERLARAVQLGELLAGELDAYRARCRAQEFTGWSGAYSGPIRYAS